MVFELRGAVRILESKTTKLVTLYYHQEVSMAHVQIKQICKEPQLLLSQDTWYI